MARPGTGVDKRDFDRVVNRVIKELGLEPSEAKKVVCKAVEGGEIHAAMQPTPWFEERFCPNTVSINEAGYTAMCIDALKILGSTAATDFGGSRQRDLGQLWADMTRGYLGEYAVKEYLRIRWGIEVELGHERGALEDYLPMDIHQIRDPQGGSRPPKIGIGIKTTKWNGIWFDIPGDQFSHSDVHILVKIGTGRDHLFAYFKLLSVFRDKVLRRGVESGVLSEAESAALFERLPSFQPIRAYICGFVASNAKYRNRDFDGWAGRTKYHISAWNGPIRPGDVEAIKTESGCRSIEFQGIGSFQHDSGHLFNTGNLCWKPEQWSDLIGQL
ncbi:MAG: hypothetical protein AB1664_13290 [Thermodesulfobacteriota bacterium]